MDVVGAFILAAIVGLLFSLLAAWVFTFTGFGWEFWEYFALAVGINIASKF
jgi:hypothetical protein